MSTRQETDFLGSLSIPEQALYGIHAARAVQNFPNHLPFSKTWYKAMGQVKQAYYVTYRHFARAINDKYPAGCSLKLIDEQVLHALEQAASEVGEGFHYEHCVVPAVQGGAGTSINMNINEIIANVALFKIGQKPGDYHRIDPIEHANVYQSTNDVVPSALKLAAITALATLETSINELRQHIERLEASHRHSLRVGFTQMQEAVPTTFGRLLGSYNDALSRDWWRISKCQERLKQLNLGGGAVGTGLAVPRYFIFEVTKNLRNLTNVPVARAENLADATSNLDCFTEVHALIKALAVNLEKISNDIRLLASDLMLRREMSIPPRQAGSSIMPGKVNPVILEYVISVSHTVYANDVIISSLCASGCLELNAYIPVIGHRLLESIELLTSACQSLLCNLVQGLEINTSQAHQHLFSSPAISTALVPFVGYNRAGLLSHEMKTQHSTIFEANQRLSLLPEQKLHDILLPENLVKEGFSVDDLM